MQSLGIIEDGALLVSNGVIREVGSTRRIEHLAAARHADVLDVTGKLLMPAFVDCHTRLLHTPADLGYFEDRCRAGSWPDAPAPQPIDSYSAQRMDADGNQRLRRLIRQGTAAIGSGPSRGDTDRTAMRMLRVQRDLPRNHLELVPSVVLNDESTNDTFAHWKRQRLARLIEIPAQMDRVRAAELIPAAQRLGFLHKVDQDAAFALEHNARSLVYGGSGFEAALGASNTVTILLPALQLLRGKPPLPLRHLVDCGVPVAVASGYGIDGNPTSNLAAVSSLACLQSALSPAEAIIATTINAAYALGIEPQLGSLSVGKRADLLVLNASDYREIPFQLGTNLIRIVLRGGEMVFPRAVNAAA
jgi:imidazolonepropionase